MNNMASVQLKNVSKVYTKEDYRNRKDKNSNIKEGVLAVDSVNIDIEDKEFIVLVGPSGCGKSTTLRMIAGLEGITSGELYIGGKLMNQVEPKDRDIAMVFQEYALYPHMTVRENLEFPLKVQKLTKEEMNEIITRVAQTLDITEYLDRKPKELSGGQKQRVAIGRAIVREPNVLLMDEPLSNLDAKLRNQMRAELLKLHEKIQTTIIYVTHDQTEAMTLGDRIVIMKGGVIQQIASPQDAFDHPSNTFVAGFIGTPQMNFFDGRLVKADNYYIEIGDYKEEVSPAQNAILKEKNIETQDVTIGIRPQHIDINKNGKGIEGNVDVRELMGSEVHIHVKACDKDIIIIAATADVDYKNMRIGDRISFSFKNENIHLFDKENGNNLCN